MKSVNIRIVKNRALILMGSLFGEIGRFALEIIRR